MSKQQKTKKKEGKNTDEKEKGKSNLENNPQNKKNLGNNQKKKISHYLKIHKKELLRSIIILIILTSLYVSSATIVNIRSSYAEQIMMETHPQHIRIQTRQEQEEDIRIETELRTNLFCQSICEYKLIDLSKGEVTDNGTFSFSNHKKHEYETTLSTNRLGTGQEIHLFEISCKNQESRMCKATKLPVLRTAIITLNYDPSEEQQLEKIETQRKISEIAQIINEGQTNLLRSQLKTENITQMKKNHLEAEITKTKFFRNILEKDIEKIKKDWQTQNYTYIKEEIQNYNVVEKAATFKEQSQHLINEIRNEISTYNLAIDTLKEFRENLSYLNTIQKTLLITNKTQQNELQDLHAKNMRLMAQLNEQRFENYHELTNLIFEIQNKNNEINQSYTEIINDTNLFIEATTWLNLIKNDLCLFQNEENCTENVISNETPELSETNLTSEQIINKTNQLCDEIKYIKQTKEEITTRQQDIRVNLTEQQITLIDEEKNKIEQSMIRWQIRQLHPNQTMTRELLLKYSQQINQTVTSEYYPEHHDEEKQIYSLPAQYLMEDLEKYYEICSSINYEFIEIKKEKETIQEYNIVAPDTIILEDVSAICCFNSTCKPCCDNDECRQEQRNPLIVLHGYSFYSFNSALHSTNAFNDFIGHIMQDGYYYPAGIISPTFYPEYETYDLTRNYATPIFKATYYDVIRFGDIHGELNFRTQSITEHAEKLDELIKYVKKTTGKEEVDIVAHSMGGLVTRAYIDKYGEDSLGKIILVGTPNHGVPSRLVYLCRFFGGQTECDDMYQDSAFMKHMNGEAKIPEKEIHMIIGIGCNTFGAEGDGIVQTRSAELNYTTNYYFEGSCDLIDNFHRDMIKPTLHKEIYEKIKELLNT